MMFTMLSFVPLLAFASLVLSDSPACKCRPTDPCWPSPTDWSSLNTTLHGRLLQPTPPASVCYPTHTTYNTTLCSKIHTQWFTSTFHAADPISLDSPGWTGNTSGVPSCPPIFPNGTSITGDPGAGKRGCEVGRHAVFVVNATDVGDVVEGVRFAKKKGLRLVVKNTGHSFTGRSTGYGALSIWTHWMKNITYHENFRAQNCPRVAGQKAATLGAGVQVYEMYEEMDKYGVAMVGGANPTVGVMGWFTGGGHGPLSSDYGMGADNVLEATVVLPDGDVVVTNECQYPDLFYAVRGGGGGTFGVVVSATMKAHKTPQTTHHTFFLSTKGKAYQKEFYDTASWILSEFPRLKEAGLQGYFGFRKAVTPAGPMLNLNWGFYLYDKPNGTMEALFEPIRQRVEKENATLSFFSRVQSAPSFFKQFKKAPGSEPVATMNGAMGGWLIPRSALTNVSRLATTLEIAGPTMNGPAGMHITGHFSCPNINRDLDIGMNPAWRDCVMDMIPFEPVPEGSSQDVKDANAKKMTFTKQQAFRDLAPESGAYFNECDVREPDWKRAFFGKNYDRLDVVKRKYDPEDVLWCRNCVGSDRWEEQDDGAVCKVRSL